MTWVQRLKRVFNIDIETCSRCGGAVKIVACIEDPAVIEKILTYLHEHTASAKPAPLHESRAPLKPSCVMHRKKKHHAWRLSRQGICRPKGRYWPEYGNALPVFPGRAHASDNDSW